MTDLQSRINKLNADEQEALEEFLDTLTEGTLLEVARDMLMDKHDRVRLRKAFEKFQDSEG